MTREASDARNYKPRYVRRLREILLPPEGRVLDVGCGVDAYLMRLVPEIEYAVGVDLALPPPLPSGREPGGNRHNEYVKLDVRHIGSHFKPRTFDTVVALDVIEHLTKEDGWELLQAMEAIASRKVVVFTPNGFLEQPAAPDNPYQQHLSGWEVDDFVAHGYSVMGVNGWRPLRSMYAEVRWRPRRVWGRVSRLTERWTEARPTHAFQLLCHKTV